MLNRILQVGQDQHAITGRKKTSRGYITCCIKTHPYAGRDGYVFEHRLVVESRIGRYLLPGECVHHKNGVKSDNSYENLEVMKNSEHTILTHTGLRRSQATRRKQSEKAKLRFSDKRNHPEYREIPKSEMIKHYREFGARQTAIKYGVTKRVIYNRLHEWRVPLNNAQ